jgi:tripartite-type tricarboxylate transporter receptor subunit TctC
MRRWSTLAVILALLALAGCGSDDASFPSRPVTLIVPFPAAGSSDILARLVSERAERSLGQPIVIENRPGAGGNIGTELAARAPADGYTLVLCTIGTCAINPALYEKMPYDLERDFRAVILFGSIANLLTVNPSVPARDVAELVALAKSRPGKLSFGSSGYGSSPHLAGELFKQAAGIDLIHVPYRGSAPAITDLRGGQIDVFFDNTPSILPQVKAGAVRALATTGAVRSPLVPDVPTMAESGYRDFVIAPWFGVMTARATPDEMVDRINGAYDEALRDAAIVRRLAEIGMTAHGGPAESFQEHIRKESTRWGALVKQHGIRAEELN